MFPYLTLDVACEGTVNVVCHGWCPGMPGRIGSPGTYRRVGVSAARSSGKEDAVVPTSSNECSRGVSCVRSLGGACLSFSSALRTGPPLRGLYLSTSMRRTACSTGSSPVQFSFCCSSMEMTEDLRATSASSASSRAASSKSLELAEWSGSMGREDESWAYLLA